MVGQGGCIVNRCGDLYSPFQQPVWSFLLFKEPPILAPIASQLTNQRDISFQNITPPTKGPGLDQDIGGSNPLSLQLLLL